MKPKRKAPIQENRKYIERVFRDAPTYFSFEKLGYDTKAGQWSKRVLYENQVNPNLYTPRSLHRRQDLLQNKQILRLIDLAFHMSKSALDGYRDDDVAAASMAYSDYIRLHIRMSKCLRDRGFDTILAFRNAQQEFIKDTAPSVLNIEQRCITKAEFRKALFELVDTWTVSTDVIEYIHFMKTLTRRIADFRDGKLVLRDVASIGNCKNPLPPIGWNLHMKQRPQTRNPFVKAAGAADSQDEATEIDMKILQPNNDDTATEDVSHDKHDDGEKVLEGVTIETIQRIVAHRTSPSYACQSPVDIARRYQATMPCGELTQNCECVPPLMYAYPAQQLNHISSADAHPRSKTKPDDVDYKDRQEDEGEIEDEAQCNTPDAEDTNCNHTEPRRLQFLTRMPQPNPAPPRAITNTRLPSLIIDVYDLNPADEPRYPSGRASERLTRVECSRPGSAKEGSQAIHSRPRFSKPIDEELFLRLMRRGCSRSSCLSRFCHHRPYSIATEAGNGGISVVPKRKMSTSKQGRQYAAVKAFCDSGHKRSSKRARKRWAKTMKRLMRMDEIPGEAMFIVRRKTTNRGIVVRRDS